MSLFDKLRSALSNTSHKISDGINNIFYKKKLDEDTIDQLEELLLSSDIGVDTSREIISNIRDAKFDESEATSDAVKNLLADIVHNIMSEHATNFSLVDGKLNTVVVCGVNGNGKTTTIGKLAHLYSSQGKKVLIAACDTFRAAAKEQMIEWGKRSECDVLVGSDAQDPASLAHQAMQVAIDTKADLLFIDTAGRLQNQANLMAELSKILKVIKKLDADAPHHVLLVIDATIGQNAFSQVEHFLKVANVTGIIVTKLDGTAKAGVIVGIVNKFKLPVYFIGIGEKLDDLREFDSMDFAKNIVGV